MEIVTELSTCEPPAAGSAVTIGAYDGVHLGHRALLGELRSRAEEGGLTTTVVTFDRHPATVVRPESAPKLLCDLDQKLELLESAGVDRTVVVAFDEDRANETAEEFVEEILIEDLGTRLVVVGEDFHFGHGRKGNVALLREMGAEAGFAVEGVSLRSDRDRAGPGRRTHLVDPYPQPGRGGPGGGRGGTAGPTPPGQGQGGPRRSSGRDGARVPYRQCRSPRRYLPARGRDLRRLVRATGRVGQAGGRLGRPPPDLLRDGRRSAGRGLRARLLR